MVDVTMSMEEYLGLLNGISMDSSPAPVFEDVVVAKKKRSSAYSKRYKANFKKIQDEYKLKNGNWKKNGFKRAVTEAHRMSKK